MNYSVIKNCDIANGPGCRVSIFVSGCTNHCPDCFQTETWDFEYGKPFTKETAYHIVDLMQPDYISGLSILGGEPMDPRNIEKVDQLISVVTSLTTQKTIWLYSGYTYERLKARCGLDGYFTDYILGHIDVLVDGPFMKARKNIGLQFKGSENQRIIDMKKTSLNGKIVLWE